MVPRTHYAKGGDVHIAYQVVGDGPFDLAFMPGFEGEMRLYAAESGAAPAA
jgi:hypothetical protein